MQTNDLPRTVAYARFGYAAAAFVAPRLATGIAGLSTKNFTPAARAWARFFATREAAMGAVTLGLDGADPALRRKAHLLNAAVDAADAVAATLLARRQRSVRFFVMAVPAGVASVAAHLRAAQQLSGAAA